MIIKCIVAAINSNGEPDLHFVKVRCSTEQYENGEHYKAAKLIAYEDGYDPCLAYDEFDSAGKAMVPLFEWDSASIIEPSEESP